MSIKNLTSLSTVQESLQIAETDSKTPQSELELVDTKLETLTQKRYEKVKKDTFETLSKLKFKVYLNVFVSKNNISWVVTDVTRKQIYYKISGGYTTKKGYLRNSQKVALKNLQSVTEILTNLKVDYVFCAVKSAYGTKKHLPTTRSVLKLLESLKTSGFTVFDHVINTTARNVSYTRPQGGKKGRR